MNKPLRLITFAAATLVALSGSSVHAGVSAAEAAKLKSELTPLGGITAKHRERWWLYPGVGLVRREVHIQRGDVATFEVRRFAPGLPD